MKRKVVITGIGSVSAAGVGTDVLWTAAAAGKSLIERIASQDTPGTKAFIGGKVKDFCAADHMDRKSARRLDLSGQFALAAGSLAVEDSGVASAPDSERIDYAVIDGSGVGALGKALEQYHDLLDGVRGIAGPMMLVCGMAGSSSAVLARRYGFRGKALTVSLGSVSSASAIGLALRAIQYNEYDVVLSGGTEAPLHEAILGPFSRAGVLSRNIDDPSGACKPFAKDRDGIVIGEGAAYLVLEELNHALSRGAKIYCEVAGFSENTDALHPTAPDPEAFMLTRAIRSSLAEASIDKSAVGYINLHGTGTILNDATESCAVRETFGAREKQPRVNSTKPISGHLIGASGAVEAIIVSQSLQKQIIPPNVNSNPLDPKCEINLCGDSIERTSLEAALSVNVSFGGRNTCLAFKRYDINQYVMNCDI